MLGNRTIDNIKAIGSSKPSLYVAHYDKDVNVCLYIDKKSEYSDYEVIGTVSVEKQEETINGRPVYKVVETSGAYPGFGSLTYQSLLIELASRGDNGLFISDRESITNDAVKIYDKLIASNDFEAIQIPSDDELFLYEINCDKELPEDHVLNHAYAWTGNELAMKYHQLLVNNHESRKLPESTLETLLEECEYVGEWVENNIDELIELRDNNFADLRSFSPKEDALEY